jgi:hypothetical protein
MTVRSTPNVPGREVAAAVEPRDSPPFRFYDNRQKYLAFVNTCNEKATVARRAARELSQLRPYPPALRIFDAGMGDATVLSRLMGSAHRDFPMHTLPSEIGDRIGTSTLFAAWNAVIYVNQVEDERLDPVVMAGSYLEATQDVLQKHGGLWFNDEAFVVTRRPGDQPERSE